MVKEFHLTMRLRNNLIRRRREELGLSIPKLAEACGLPYPAVLDLEGLKASPLTKSGEWRKAAVSVAEFFGCTPGELFPDSVLKVVAPEIKSEIDAQKVLALADVGMVTELPALPEETLSAVELCEAINSAVSELAPREQEVLRLRYVEDMTLEQCAQMLSRSRERIRMTEAKALRKLRHPALASRIMAAAEGRGDTPNPKTMSRGRVCFEGPKVFTSEELRLAKEVAEMACRR